MQATTELRQPSSRTRPHAENCTAAQVFLETLAALGVRAAFGIPGGLCSPLFDALRLVPAIRPVYTRHEAMAGYAAMGHAVATGYPGLVITTGGPGLTNAVTAAAAAFVDEIPMIVVSGEVARGAGSRGAFQDATTNALDAVAMMRTVTRWSARVDAPENVPGMVQHAFEVATGSNPGPVYLALPLDVGLACSEPAPLFPARPSRHQPDPAACARVAGLLHGARRPLLVAGSGVRSAEAELLELAERTSCPVVTTPHAKGVFPESSPLHLGMIGLGGHPSARRYLHRRPDVVCVVGSRLGEIETDCWTLPLTGTEATIQIDNHACLVGRNVPVTLGVVGDVGWALEQIVRALPNDVAMVTRQVTGIELAEPEAPRSDQVPLHPARVLASLREAFPDAFFATDLGEHAVLALHYLQVDDPRQFRTLWGLGAMGSGIGLAIGAKHAEPDRTVVCICGDGGFAMHAGDLLSCVQQGVDVVFAVMNDGCWNMVEQGFSSVYGRSPASMPEGPADLAAVARAYGAVGARVQTPMELDPERLRALASQRRPVLLDIRTDPRVALSPAGRNEAMKRDVQGGVR